MLIYLDPFDTECEAGQHNDRQLQTQLRSGRWDDDHHPSKCQQHADEGWRRPDRPSHQTAGDRKSETGQIGQQRPLIQIKAAAQTAAR